MPRRDSGLTDKHEPSDTPAPSPRRASREETTERILDAAEELFATRSPETVTVREVADQAGITHALVHQYVGSKDNLFDAVIHRGAPDRQQLIRDAAGYQEVLPELFDNVLAHRVHSRAQIRAAMDGTTYTSLDRPIETGRMLVAQAEQAVASGCKPKQSCHGTDPRVVGAAFAALAYGWVAVGDWLAPLFDLDDVDPEELQDQLRRIAECVGDMVFPAEPGSEA